MNRRQHATALFFALIWCLAGLGAVSSIPGVLGALVGSLGIGYGLVYVFGEDDDETEGAPEPSE